MSPTERNSSSVLIVDSALKDRHQMRSVLGSLGFGSVFDAANHQQAQELLVEGAISHVIVDTKLTSMPARDFIQRIFEWAPRAVVIPISYAPTVEDVFEYLILGARGMIVKPFTIETLDYTIVTATKGDPYSADVCEAADRNQVLASTVVNHLDKLATLLKQARQFETAKREVPRAVAVLRRSAEIARTYAKDGQEALLATIEEVCLERGNGPARRLRRSPRVSDEN